MDRIEEFLRQGILNRQRGILMEKTLNCPDEGVLIDYISSAPKAEGVEPHIADCPWCLEQILIAYEAGQAQPSFERPPQDIVKRAKDIVPVKSSSQARTRALKRNLWLLATIVAFALSFIFPPHFLQFLAAALILGIKWVAESEQLRTLIITLDARRDRKEAGASSTNRIKERIEK